MKTCSKCKVEKAEDQFSKNKAFKDGLQCYCKACIKLYYQEHKTEIAAYQQNHKSEIAAYQKVYRESHKTEIAAYQQEHKVEISAKQKVYYQTPAGKLSQRKRVKRYQAANPEKKKAQSAVNRAIKAGKLTRPSGCPQCGKLCTPEGHHTSYLKEDRLKVMWLCKACHIAIHQAYAAIEQEYLKL